MLKSDSIAKLAAAMVAVQSELQPAIKDKLNPGFKGAKYADLNAVWDAARPYLTKNGIAVLQFPSEAAPGFIGLVTILMHVSGEYIEEKLVIPLSKQDPQGAGSGLTYARRYAFSGALGIVADEDDDGNAASRYPVVPVQGQPGRVNFAKPQWPHPDAKSGPPVTKPVDKF